MKKLIILAILIFAVSVWAAPPAIPPGPASGVSTYAEIEALDDYPWSAECTGYLKSDGTCGIPGIFGTLDPETDDGKYATLNYNAEAEVWEVAAGNTPTDVTAEDGSILKLSGSDIVAATEGTDYAGAGTDIATFAWDGGGSAVGTSLGKACKVVAYAATITQVSLSMDTSATVIIKLYKDAFSDEALPTTDITNGAFVTTTAKRGLVDSTLTDWTVSVSAGDEICAELTTNDNATRASLIISGVR